MEDRKNGQKRQPEARRPEEDRARKPIELDPDQMEKVSGGAPSIPPEWLMKDEKGNMKKLPGLMKPWQFCCYRIIPRSCR